MRKMRAREIVKGGDGLATVQCDKQSMNKSMLKRTGGQLMQEAGELAYVPAGHVVELNAQLLELDTL